MRSARTKELWYRLRNDFQLAIITLFGACSALGISPFAAYRFIRGDTWIGAFDTSLVLGILAAVLHAWISGNTQRAGLILVLINTVGSVLATVMLGLPGVMWMYPALLASFFLVDHRKAVAANGAALAAVALHGKAFESPLLMLLFLVTASLVSLLAFVFAHRTETQRRQLEQQATHDPLTGVQNRRAMERELQIATGLHRRGQPACGMLMLDLDHFKRVNDQHGHDAGDAVLVAFAELIGRSTRQVDRLFRFGGEEFVLLLSPASTPAMEKIANHLCLKVATELRCRGDRVTVSIGGAALRPDEDMQCWMVRADTALYRAKREGRNRAVIDAAEADAEPPPPPPRPPVQAGVRLHCGNAE